MDTKNMNEHVDEEDEEYISLQVRNFFHHYLKEVSQAAIHFWCCKLTLLDMCWVGRDH